MVSEVAALEEHLAGDDLARRGVDQPHDGAGADALARAAFAQDAQGFRWETWKLTA